MEKTPTPLQNLAIKLFAAGPLLKVIEVCIGLDAVPDLVDPFHGIVGQGAPLDDGDRVPQLLNLASAGDDGVAVLALELRVVGDPAPGELGAGDALALGDALPEVESVEEAGLVVQAVVELGVDVVLLGRLDPAAALVALDLARQLGLALGQEAAGDGAVGVEADAVFPQRREHLGLCPPGDGAVAALVHGGEHVAVLLADGHDLLNVAGQEVGEAEFLEAALLVQLIETAERLFPGESTVGGVKVVNVDLEERTVNTPDLMSLNREGTGEVYYSQTQSGGGPSSSRRPR